MKRFLGILLSVAILMCFMAPAMAEKEVGWNNVNAEGYQYPDYSGQTLSFMWWGSDTRAKMTEEVIHLWEEKTGAKVEFEYYDGTQKKYMPAASSKEKLNSLATGQFYHIVGTLNKKDNTLNVWVNGQNVISKANFKAEAPDVMGFPKIGSTPQQKGMWFCLGGDPGNYVNGYTDGKPTYSTTAQPDACENSCKTTWVYAKIYDHALTATEATSLYTADVKAFTEPAQPGESTHNLLLDTRFGESSNGADASAFKAALTSKNAVATAYNSKFGRFEGQFSDKTNTTALQRDYVADPAFTSMLNTTYSLEVYMKATDNTWTNIPSFKRGPTWLCLPICGGTSAIYLIYQIYEEFRAFGGKR